MGSRIVVVPSYEQEGGQEKDFDNLPTFRFYIKPLWTNDIKPQIGCLILGPTRRALLAHAAGELNGRERRDVLVVLAFRPTLPRRGGSDRRNCDEPGVSRFRDGVPSACGLDGLRRADLTEPIATLGAEREERPKREERTKSGTLAQRELDWPLSERVETAEMQGAVPLPEELATTAAKPVAGPMSTNVGDTIKHYEIIRTLGRGGMGVVFLARDTRLGRLVALKLLHEHSGLGVERFLAEARATARCRHENIVVIYEVDEIHGYPFMALEYVKGRTLREWMFQRELSGAPGSPVPHTRMRCSRRCHRANSG